MAMASLGIALSITLINQPAATEYPVPNRLEMVESYSEINKNDIRQNALQESYVFFFVFFNAAFFSPSSQNRLIMVEVHAAKSKRMSLSILQVFTSKLKKCLLILFLVFFFTSFDS